MLNVISPWEESFTMVDDREARMLRRLQNIFERFREISETLTMGKAEVLLLIAREPGLSGIDVGQKLDLSQSTYSRHLMDYSEQLRDKSPGHGLLIRTNQPDSFRKNSYRLSPRGRLLIKTVIRELEQMCVDLPRQEGQ